MYRFIYFFKRAFNGFLSLRLKNFTMIPVRNAEIMVPSLIPTMVKSKNNNDNRMDIITHVISNAIFTLPNSWAVVSEIAFTNASPAFMITFAITANEIPKPRMVIPISTRIILMK